MLQPFGDPFRFLRASCAAEDLSLLLRQKGRAWLLMTDTCSRLLRPLAVPDDLYAHLNATAHFRQVRLKRFVFSNDVTLKLFFANKRAEPKRQRCLPFQNTLHHRRMR